MTRYPFALSLCLLLTGPAAAQTQWQEVRDAAMVAPFNLSADVVEDMEVVNAGGQKIGEVDKVIGLTPSEASALVIDFEDNAGYTMGSDDEIVVPLAGFALAGGKLQLLGDAATVKGYEIYRD
jgi:hypothetical protein